MRSTLLVALALTISSAVAQDSLRFKGTDLYRFGDAVVHIYTQPVRWDKKDYLTLGAVVAGTGLLLLADEPLRPVFTGGENRFKEGVREIGFHYGKPYSAFTVTGGFYLVGLVLNDRWAKDTGIALGVTLLTSGFLQTIMKDAIGRARPDTNVGAHRVDWFSGSPAWHSFPSGHQAVALGISLVLAKRVQSVPLKIFFYSLAGTTFFSRLYSDSHWVSDMAFGGALAWFCADTAFKRLGLNEGRSKQGGISWKFNASPTGMALTGTFR